MTLDELLGQSSAAFRKVSRMIPAGLTAAAGRVVTRNRAFRSLQHDVSTLKAEVKQLKKRLVKAEAEVRVLRTETTSVKAELSVLKAAVGPSGAGRAAANARPSSEEVERLFTGYVHTKRWGSKESQQETVSGNGSTLAYTENIRRELPVLVRKLGVTQILDAPCGDYNWFRAIQWQSDVSYLGADVVRALVERNQERYGGATTRFVQLNIISDALPELGKDSLWLCRDCLFHLTYAQIFDVLNNFMRSNITYLLTSTHSEHPHNVDIPMGKFRTLNLERPPFNLPKPRAAIEDWIKPYRVRYLALWTRSDIADHVASRNLPQLAGE